MKETTIIEKDPLDCATSALMQMMDALSNPENALEDSRALLGRAKALNETVSKVVEIQKQKDDHTKTRLAVLNTAADLGFELKPQMLQLEEK